MTNRFNKHNFIKNQAKLDIFDMLKRSLNDRKPQKTRGSYLPHF
jgi:hypothetical protein